MAFAPHVRVQFGGDVHDNYAGGNVIEEWTNTFSLDRDNATAPSMPSLTTTVAGLVRTFFMAGGTGIWPGVKLKYVKVNQIDATGHQIDDPTHQVVYDDSSGGGGDSSIHLPLTTSLRVTLDDATRNRRAKGGFYLPRLGIPVGVDGRFSASTCAGIVTTTKTMMDAINALTGISLVIASKAGGTLIPVTRVRVGDVPDNISRRRDDLREVYSTATLAP